MHFMNEIKLKQFLNEVLKWKSNISIRKNKHYRIEYRLYKNIYTHFTLTLKLIKPFHNEE